jgi:hypothetical protein
MAMRHGPDAFGDRESPVMRSGDRIKLRHLNGLVSVTAQRHGIG